MNQGKAMPDDVRTGRPSTPPPKRRLPVLTFRVSEEERAIIHHLAALSNRRPSVFMREACLSPRIVVLQTMKLDPLAHHDLSRVGNLLNQIARHLHMTGDSRRLAEIDGLLLHLRTLLDRTGADEFLEG